MMDDQSNLERLRELSDRLHTTEDQLIRANALLAAIVEDSQEAIIGKDLDGIVQTWNPAAERIYGYTSYDMIGESVTKIIPEHKMEEWNWMMEQVRKGNRVPFTKTVRVRKDGNEIDVVLAISPIKARTGAVIGASTIAHRAWEL